MNGLRDASAVFHVLCILAVNVEYGNDDVSSNTVLGQVNFKEYTVEQSLAAVYGLKTIH